MGLGDFNSNKIIDNTMNGGLFSIAVPTGIFKTVVSKPASIIKEPDVTILPVEKQVDVSIMPVKEDIKVSVPETLISDKEILPVIKLPEPAKEVTELIMSRDLNDALLDKGGEIALSKAGELITAGIIPLVSEAPQVLSEKMVETLSPTDIKEVKIEKIIEKTQINYKHPILKYMKG